MPDTVVDHTRDFVGRHLFPVTVCAGPDKTRLYVSQRDGEPMQQMGMHGPGFGVLEILTTQGVRWPAARAAMDRRFTLPSTAMIAVLGTLSREALFTNGLIHNFARADAPRSSAQSDWDLIVTTKAAMDQAGMIAPDFLPAAAMSFLSARQKGTRTRYRRLIDIVNRVLARQDNASALAGAPIATVSDIESLSLWFVKEGDLTTIFQAEVSLTDRRRALFVLNVAKDRKAAERQSIVHREMQFFSRRDPRVMTPYQIDDVHVLPRALDSLALSPADVTVSAGEWLTGFDELHLYPGDSRFHLWQDQRDTGTTPFSREISDRLWREILQLHVRVSGLGRDDFKPLWTHINAGDFVTRPRDGGSLEVKMIGTRGPSVAPHHPSPESYLAALLLFSAVDDGAGHDGAQTIWWGDPDQAIAALTVALDANGLSRAAVSALWTEVHNRALPAMLRSPSVSDRSDQLTGLQHAEYLRLIQLTAERLAAHLVD